MKELEAIKERAERATLGPWDAVEGSDYDGVDTLLGTLTWDDHGGEVFKPTDAEFIAHARTDVPKLIAALEAVQKLVDDTPRLVCFGGETVCGSIMTDSITKAITEALA